MFDLDNILAAKFSPAPEPPVYAGAERRAAEREDAVPAREVAEHKKPRRDNFTKVEPYEYGGISVGDYIKYVTKNGDLKGGIVKKIQITDGEFEFGLAKGSHFWYINNNNTKEIRVKYAKPPTRPPAQPPRSQTAAVQMRPEAQPQSHDLEEALRRIEKLEQDNLKLVKMLSIIWKKIKEQPS